MRPVAKPKDDSFEVVRSYGIILAGHLRRAAALGPAPPCVSFENRDGHWTLFLADGIPRLRGEGAERLNERIAARTARNCGAPLVFVDSPPAISFGCLRCYYGVDVVDLFPRRRCP